MTENSREDIAVLIEQLQPGSWDSRRMAAEALGSRGAREAIPNLYAVLRYQYTDDVLEAVAAALAKLEARELVPVLIEDLMDKEHGNRQYRAAVILRELRAEEAKPYLLRLLWDRELHPRTNRAVMDALAGLWTRHDSDTLLEIHHNHWDVIFKAEAMRILEEL